MPMTVQMIKALTPCCANKRQLLRIIPNLDGKEPVTLVSKSHVKGKPFWHEFLEHFAIHLNREMLLSPSGV